MRPFEMPVPPIEELPVTPAASMDRLADLAIASLRSQVEAGASALQLFDSWVGALSPADYERYVMPSSARVLAGVADLGWGMFGNNTGMVAYDPSPRPGHVLIAVVPQVQRGGEKTCAQASVDAEAGTAAT